MNLEGLDEALQPVLQAHSIARHRISLSGQPPVLQVMIMNADGSMDMDTCAAVSRDLSDKLDELNWGDGPYTLDVCSFGAERPLKTEQEMQEAVGRYVHIDLKDPKQGMDSVEGTLQAVGGGSVTVEYLVKGRKKTADVSRENIRLIRLAVK